MTAVIGQAVSALPGSPFPLGANPGDEGSNFAVASAVAFPAGRMSEGPECPAGKIPVSTREIGRAGPPSKDDVGSLCSAQIRL
jgi:hypothetical protein